MAVHLASGIPVDLFTATPANWWHCLVRRTGSAENNGRIASAAKARGSKWNPYDSGFTRVERTALAYSEIPADSERKVFEIAGLPYLEPWQR